MRSRSCTTKGLFPTSRFRRGHIKLHNIHTSARRAAVMTGTSAGRVSLELYFDTSSSYVLQTASKSLLCHDNVSIVSFSYCLHPLSPKASYLTLNLQHFMKSFSSRHDRLSAYACIFHVFHGPPVLLKSYSERMLRGCGANRRVVFNSRCVTLWVPKALFKAPFLCCLCPCSRRPRLSVLL